MSGLEGSIWLNHESAGHYQPRASRILLPGHIQVATEIWVGGGSSESGHDLAASHLSNAWLVDCANEFPPDLHAAATLTLFRVFSDLEERPHNWERVDRLASTIAASILGQSPGNTAWDHPGESPGRVVVVCKQGLNRSALMAGRILRGVGLSGDEAVAAIRAARPGALNNVTFEQLVRQD